MTVATSNTAVLRIATPEGVTFSLPLAGPVTRAFAVAIDFLVIMLINKLLNVLVIVLSAASEDLGAGAQTLMGFVIAFGYSAIAEMLFNGQTLGKRVLHIRVMDERGLRLKPGQVLIRNLLRVADFLPVFYGLGGLACLFSKRCQRMGDLAAGTIVVREVKRRAPDVEQLMDGKYNSFRNHPHLEARLRQKISPDEAQAALASIIRKDELEQDARLKLFSLVAKRFRTVVDFPEEVTFGLSDEQYVRNVVDSLYRRSK